MTEAGIEECAFMLREASTTGEHQRQSGLRARFYHKFKILVVRVACSDIEHVLLRGEWNGEIIFTTV